MFADLVVVQQFLRLVTKVQRQKGLKVSRELGDCGGGSLWLRLLVFPIAEGEKGHQEEAH